MESKSDYVPMLIAKESADFINQHFTVRYLLLKEKYQSTKNENRIDQKYCQEKQPTAK